jgi:hypothetical protein
MVGNPLLLLFGFTIFPTVLKAANPYLKDFLNSSTNPFGGSSSTRAKKRSQRAPTYSNRDDYKENSGFGPPSESNRASYTEAPRYDSEVPRYDAGVPRYESDNSRQRVPVQRSSLGGWDDLEEDRSRFQADSQYPIQRRGKSGKKLVKRREDPLVVRVILAFFPFLRRWGFF